MTGDTPSPDMIPVYTKFALYAILWLNCNMLPNYEVHPY